uniref:ATP synthase complex subunit 8 n=1 Tax=Aneurus sublobatus TaxID=1176473 RepID=A0A172DYT5_9HEMI|nr:ATP synthase F0 subunit 8 [Aneurus sublobatus]AFI54685.1 ATP synthase F0 subunit 8 [Aneurus sublobatus]
MPQMAPIWWTSVSSSIIMAMMITSSIIYFTYQPEKVKKSHTINVKSKNWKW